MSDFDWKHFLKEWSKVMAASPHGEDLPMAARASEWLGFPPATDEQIAAAEDRLRIALPPSYESFLRISNGWLRTTHAIEQLCGVEQIDWFRKQNQQWISAYTKPAQFMPPEKAPDGEYFAYGQFAADFRTEQLKETLQISEIGDAAVYVLNPQVINKDGEWEAWFIARWLPGVRRYRSFQEMMRAEFNEMSGGDWRPPDGVIGGLPDEYVGSPGSPKRRIKKRTRPRKRKILGKPYDQWTVDELLEMLRNPEFGIIHGEVIEGLGLLGDSRAAEPLIALFRQTPDIDTMYALKKLAPEWLPDLLLEVISRRNVGCILAAGHIMAEMNDNRAIPPLVCLLCDTSPEAAYEADHVRTILSEFGTAGYNALVGCLAHPAPRVRLRALSGLGYTNRPETGEVLQPMLNDRDPAVRDAARSIIDLQQSMRTAKRR